MNKIHAQFTLGIPAILLLLSGSIAFADHTSVPTKTVPPERSVGQLPYSVRIPLTPKLKQGAYDFWDKMGKINRYWVFTGGVYKEQLAEATEIDLMAMTTPGAFGNYIKILSLTEEGRKFLHSVLPLFAASRVKVYSLHKKWQREEYEKLGNSEGEGTYMAATRELYFKAFDRSIIAALPAFVHEWSHAITHNYGPKQHRHSTFQKIKDEHIAFRMQQLIEESIANISENYAMGRDWSRAGKGTFPTSMKEFIKNMKESYIDKYGLSERDIDAYARMTKWDDYKLDKIHFWKK